MMKLRMVEKALDAVEMASEEWWVSFSDAEIDYMVILFDSREVFVENVKTYLEKSIGIALIKKLAKISRGIFNPTVVRE